MLLIEFEKLVMGLFLIFSKFVVFFFFFFSFSFFLFLFFFFFFSFCLFSLFFTRPFSERSSWMASRRRKKPGGQTSLLHYDLSPLLSSRFCDGVIWFSSCSSSPDRPSKCLFDCFFAISFYALVSKSYFVEGFFFFSFFLFSFFFFLIFLL